MLNSLHRLEVLNEICPFIQRLSGRIIVIKYGGSAMKNQDIKIKVLQDILFLSSIGIKIVLVHGGGPIINSWLQKFNIEPKFHNGIRITDRQTMEIVEMVLVGKVNKDLVTLLNNKINYAVGLSGKDSNLVLASSLFQEKENFTGKIDLVNTKILDILLNNNYIPVIASVAAGINGQTYNINADTFAGVIAASLSAEKLIFLTDTSGVMKDINDSNTLLRCLNIHQVELLKKDKVISGGMIPKVDCCITALQDSVKATHIIDGSIQNSLLLELLTLDRIGSMITE